MQNRTSPSTSILIFVHVHVFVVAKWHCVTFILFFHFFFCYNSMFIFIMCVCVFCSFFLSLSSLMVMMFCHMKFTQCAAIVQNSFIPFAQLSYTNSTATRIISWCDTWMELHNYAKKNEECSSTIATATITTIASMMMIKNGLIFYVSAICIPVGYLISFLHKSTCFISLHALNAKNTRPICGQKHQRRNYSKRSIDCVYSWWWLSLYQINSIHFTGSFHLISMANWVIACKSK